MQEVTNNDSFGKALAKYTKGLGMIRFGKSRSDPTKYVKVDITYDKKAEKDLYECGMIALKHDKEAVIQYVIVKALTGYAKCKK